MKSIHYIHLVIFLLVTSCVQRGGSSESINAQADDTLSEITPVYADTAAFSNEEDTGTPGVKRKSAQSARNLFAMEKSMVPPSQTFELNSLNDTVVIGEKGTIIYVIPEMLEALDGSPPGESITVYLTEVQTKSGMILNKLQTVCGDSILISDGMYNVRMLSGDKELRIKKGDGLECYFPRNDNEEMNLFSGQRDANWNIDWTLADSSLMPGGVPRYKYDIVMAPMDDEFYEIYYYAGTSSEEQVRAQYERMRRDPHFRLNRQLDSLKRTNNYSIGLRKFGWINFDRSLKQRNQATKLHLVNHDDTVFYCKNYVVFKNINSVLATYFSSADGYTYNFIPSGQALKIFTVAYYDSQPFIFEHDFTLVEETTLEIKFEPISVNGLLQKIQKIE